MTRLRCAQPLALRWYRSPIGSSYISTCLRTARFSTGSAERASNPPRTHKQPSLVPWATAFILLSIGYVVGESVRTFIRPPWYPDPGSPEDQIILDKIAHDIDELALVASMRIKTKSTTINADAEVGAWRELFIDNIAETESPEGTLPANPLTPRTITGTRTLTVSTLHASGLFGPQRVFYNSYTHSLVAVVWLGGNLSGWPNITHGGAIATLLDEACTRAVAGPDRGLDEPKMCKGVELSYLKPTMANRYYVVKVDVDAGAMIPTAKNLHTGMEPQGDRKLRDALEEKKKGWFTFGKPSPEEDVVVQATLETLDGLVCARAKATWDVEGAAKL
ncbi:hypothetical protein EJ05DRAFT_209202 [Pseudovirgaria hyperparasitica]|uniref:Thioesterase domain-containing protein n=1 Tax=Pseudovirgaria hyperparasitica TaxID=470096 RepID=A0A6A6VRG8_9PEZI|nr:uncharacterized protein EJ05DRAFT_209202 [Pseudovirgaria hyperparasitica]KAF2753278.1 hypothetical protein EJ05DRAFT_209202 [Pseudovirgaria hyperparasitica]